jgi:hypothetical protein
MQFGTDATCPANALGGAVVSNLAQQPLQQGLDGAINDGSMSILLQYLGLDDLSGVSDAQLSVGVLSGAPQTSPAAAYNGANALDWWFTADAQTLDVSRTPVQVSAATLAGSVLTVGPTSFVLPFNLGAPAPVAFSGAKLVVKDNGASVPLTATGGHTPGHTPSEHLNPVLTSFATAGQQTNNGAGKLCGNASAASLAAIPVPSIVVQNCSSYSAGSTMLDLIVGGCNAFGFIQLINPTQPDQVDQAAPVLGAGGPYTLSASGGGTAVDTCSDRNQMAVDFTQCLHAAAYSSYFKFTLQRAVVKP